MKMKLKGLTKEQIEMLLQSLAVNPTIEECDKAETLEWCRLQLVEQLEGGAWQSRVRQKGYVI